MNSDLGLWIGAGAIGAAITIIAWVLISARPNPAVRRNLMTGAVEMHDLHRIRLQESAGERVVKPGLSGIVALVRRFTPASMLDGLQTKMSLAGMSGRWPAEQVLLAKVALGALGLLLGVTAHGDGPMGILMLFGTPVLGFLVPDILLSSRGQRRQEAMQLDLPDFLDQVLISVEAGLAFESALLRVSERDDGPLGAEFRRTMQDIRLGASRRDAFERLHGRTSVPELQQFLSALKQADRYGIPVAKILRVQANELRLRRAQRAEERAQKVPVKIIFPVMLCFLPALFIAILGPAIQGIGKIF